MIIYLDVPYSDKEDAKAMGCQWNAKKKQWFADTQNIHQYSKWFMTWTKPERKPKKAARIDSMTLMDYLRHRHPTVNSLTMAEANIISIKYPLESGWVKKFGSINIYPETFERLEKARLARYESDSYKNKKSFSKKKDRTPKRRIESNQVIGVTGRNNKIESDNSLPWN